MHHLSPLRRGSTARAGRLGALALAFWASCKPAADAPVQVTSIAPSSTELGRSVEAVVAGRGFAAPARIDLDHQGRLDVDHDFRVRIGPVELDGDAVVVLRDTELSVWVPGTLSAGPHDVTVITPGGEATLPGGFVVDRPDPRRDAAAPDLAGDASLPLASTDAGRADGAGTDAAVGQGDAGSFPDAFACTQALDADTLAFYRFEGGVLDDTGNHDARALGTASFAAGRAPCGQALSLDGSYYLEIDDSPDWTSSVGSVDFWYRATSHPSGDPSGLVSRDENGEAGPGQLTIYHAGGGTGRLMVRMQDPTSLYLCSDAALPLDEWVHVGLSFGPPEVELYVNGVRQTATDTLPFYTDQVPCGGTGSHALGDNQNPWVVGAASDVSGPGRATPVRSFAVGAAIDELRISRARRSFGP